MISVCKNVTYICTKLTFYTRISYVLNEKVQFDKQHLFQNKEKGPICQMVHFVTQFCIVVIILENSKGIICHLTPFNSK